MPARTICWKCKDAGPAMYNYTLHFTNSFIGT